MQGPIPRHWRVMSNVAVTDPGTPADVANPAYGVQPEFDADFAWMLALDVVTLGAINGPAAGVGFVLACYCDLRFAAEGAKLTTSHGKLNLPAEYGLSWLLPRLIGLTHANDLLLSSRVVRAEEAAAMGLINRVVPVEDVLAEAMAYADQLVRLVSPTSLATTKRQIALDQLHDNVGSSVASGPTATRRDGLATRLHGGQSESSEPTRLPTGPNHRAAWTWPIDQRNRVWETSMTSNSADSLG